MLCAGILIYFVPPFPFPCLLIPLTFTDLKRFQDSFDNKNYKTVAIDF